MSVLLLADCPDVLKPMQVAAVLGIGRNKTYELLKAKKIRSIQIGAHLRIPKAAVQKILEEGIPG